MNVVNEPADGEPAEGAGQSNETAGRIAAQQIGVQKTRPGRLVALWVLISVSMLILNVLVVRLFGVAQYGELAVLIDAAKLGMQQFAAWWLVLLRPPGSKAIMATAVVMIVPSAFGLVSGFLSPLGWEVAQMQIYMFASYLQEIIIAGSVVYCFAATTKIHLGRVNGDSASIPDLGIRQLFVITAIIAASFLVVDLMPRPFFMDTTNELEKRWTLIIGFYAVQSGLGWCLFSWCLLRRSWPLTLCGIACFSMVVAVNSEIGFAFYEQAATTEVPRWQIASNMGRGLVMSLSLIATILVTHWCGYRLQAGTNSNNARTDSEVASFSSL